MFNIFNKQSILALSIAVAVIAGCKKEGMHTTVATGAKPVVTASNTNVMVFTEDTQDSVIERFSWAPTTFGYDAVISYALQFDKKGNGFANAQTVSVNGTSLSMTVKALNTIAATLKMPFGDTTGMVVRVRASVGTQQLLGDASNYSDSLVLMVDPYKVLPIYPKVYVPGSYSNPQWDPPTARALASPLSDKAYQGYLLFTDNSEFKVNVARNWTDTNYGGDAATLSTSGANLKVSVGGLYLMTANLNSLAWGVTAINSFSLNGSATTNADVDLTADDATDMTWSTTVNLSAGNFFIRANHANTIAYGDTDNDNITEPATSSNGIQIATAGKYKITFDVSNAGIYLYTVTLAQ